MNKYSMNLVKKPKFIEWKWSNGEKPDKSPRPLKEERIQPEVYNELKKQMHENQVVSQCLYPAEEMLGMRETLDQGQQQLMTEFQRQPNKREDTYNRMAEREMMGQIGMNPFLSYADGNNSGYINDLMNQENFLKPISTSIQREK